MIPFQSQLIAGGIALAVGFGAGWKVNGWRWEARWDANMAAMAREHLKKMAQAMTDYQNATKAQEYIAVTYEQEKANAKLKTDAVIAGLRRGTVRLRDPDAGVSACPSAPASPGVGDGASANKFPDTPAGAISSASAEFLIELATDADNVAAQLAACQAILRADRK